MLPCVQVLGLGTDTGDSAPSVLLFFDHYRFLFNAGEGFQRFCVQHRIRMGKTTAIFGTRSTTQALGGLPGTNAGLTSQVAPGHHGEQPDDVGEGGGWLQSLPWQLPRWHAPKM